jgi:hypothetical protein
MIKLYTALTNEVDNPEAAVRDILGQLRLDERLRKNSFGFVQFYYEYVDTGVYQALVDALPFPLAGCAATAVGAGTQYGDLSLSVAMFTSDDAEFAIRSHQAADLTDRDSMIHDVNVLLSGLCQDQQPKLVLSILPLVTHFSGDDLIAAGSTLPVPLFGSIAYSAEPTPETNYVVSGSSVSHTQMVYVAFYGDVNPEFRLVSSLDHADTFGTDAIITDADKSVLKTVNGISAVDFLEKQGILKADEINKIETVIAAIPAIFTRTDGTKIVRAFIGVADDAPGCLFSAGNLENGATLSFSCLDGDQTLASAQSLLSQLSDVGETSFIAFSCAARSWSLGAQNLDEVRTIAERAVQFAAQGNPMQYCVSYAGGEICPARNEKGELVNTLQNYTLISCSFR